VAAPEDPLDPPLPPDVLPEPCPEELAPELPLDAPLLVDAVVPSTEASLGSRVKSVPPQRTAAKITASRAKCGSFMAHRS
jgi:hypothetical protein